MKNIQSGVSAVSLVLLSILASEALASVNKARPDSAAGVQSASQTNTQRRGAGVAGNRGNAPQDKLQNENRQLKIPARVEYPNLRVTSTDRPKKATSVAVDRNLNQPDMYASKNEVSIESRENPSTGTQPQSLFLPEVEDQVLLRERGQPHKQPPSRRGPHKQPPTGRGPDKMP
jgi:hypothetical protein